VDFSELQPRVPEPPERELHPIVLPRPDPIAVGAGAGCVLVVLTPIVGIFLVELTRLPVRHVMFAVLVGAVPVVPVVGRIVMGDWGRGTLRAGAVLAVALCACWGTVFTPIEWQALPAGLGALSAALLTGALAGGVLLRRGPSDDPQRSV
jgi:hypothetical protein